MSNLQAEDAADFNRLCSELPVAIDRASRILRDTREESAGDTGTNAEVTQILARIIVLANELK
jgi:hypothetical protein